MNIHIENMYVKRMKKRLRFGELITLRAVSVGLAGQGNIKGSFSEVGRARK